MLWQTVLVERSSRPTQATESRARTATSVQAASFNEWLKLVGPLVFQFLTSWLVQPIKMAFGQPRLSVRRRPKKRDNKCAKDRRIPSSVCIASYCSCERLPLKMEGSKESLTSESSGVAKLRGDVPRASSPFLQISPILYEYSPWNVARPTHSHSATKAMPSTVVLFGSSNGPLHAMKRFARGHSALFPRARILVVLCTFKMLFCQTDQTTQDDMQLLLGELSGPEAESNSISASRPETRTEIPPIILHALSNGGLISVRALCLAWRASHGTPFPHTMLVLDSCPGSGCFNTEAFRWAESAAAPFLASNPAAGKVPGSKVLANMVALGWVATAVKLPEIMTGRENLVAAGRNCVGDAKLLDPRGSMV
jgi:hypothetical protein